MIDQTADFLPCLLFPTIRRLTIRWQWLLGGAMAILQRWWWSQFDCTQWWWWWWAPWRLFFIFKEGAGLVSQLGVWAAAFLNHFTTTLISMQCSAHTPYFTKLYHIIVPPHFQDSTKSICSTVVDLYCSVIVFHPVWYIHWRAEVWPGAKLHL